MPAGPEAQQPRSRRPGPPRAGERASAVTYGADVDLVAKSEDLQLQTHESPEGAAEGTKQ